MAVRPWMCSSAMWAPARMVAVGSRGENRPAPTDPAPTDGFTTTSASPPITRVPPSAITVVGTTGTPRAASSSRYRLSELHARATTGLASRGMPPAQARKTGRRGT